MYTDGWTVHSSHKFGRPHGSSELSDMLYIVTAALALVHKSEVWTREQEDAAGIVRERLVNKPPRFGLAAEDLPAEFKCAQVSNPSHSAHSAHRSRVRALVRTAGAPRTASPT